MKEILMVFLALLLAGGISSARAQESAPPPDTGTLVVTPAPAPPAPVTNLNAKDKPNDHGAGVVVTWTPSADDVVGSTKVFGYAILRAATPEGPFLERGRVPIGEGVFEDQGSLDEVSPDYMADHVDYYYKVRVISPDTTVYADSEIIGPVQSSGQWFNTNKVPVLIFVLCFTTLAIFFINHARRGANLFIRPLAGIEAVDEAIGRATEMGRPILYVLGLGTASEIATIASFTILGRVSKKVAEYQTGLIVPCYDPIVMTVAQETVKASYLDAGRPDAYNDDMVYFVTQSQFAYVAAVNGTMLRELPATNIYMGKFFAESLILAKTGALAGSIQIAGTDEVAQIPFFVVACDYTLIGEELYAASAYLGREPVLLGSLKAQDYAKAAIMILAVVGFLAANFGWVDFVNLFNVPSN